MTVHDFVQGNLGNCGMVAAMAGLAKDKELRGKVAPWAEQGCRAGLPPKVAFNLFKMGEAHTVEVDRKLPTFKNKLVYCRSSNGNLLGPLLEKALVQLHFGGNYELSYGIHPGLVMASLTNNLCEDFRSLTSDSSVDFEELLSHGWKTNSQMVATFWNPPPCNLIFSHCYSLIAEKNSEVTLYDPHGKIVKIQKDLFIDSNIMFEVSYPENKIFRMPDVKTRVDLTGNWSPLKGHVKMHFVEYDLLVEEDGTEILINVNYRHICRVYGIYARIFIITNGMAVVKSSVFKHENRISHAKSLRDNLMKGKYKIVVALSKYNRRVSCAESREYLEEGGREFLLRVAASKHCSVNEPAKKETGNIFNTLFDFLHFVI